MRALTHPFAPSPVLGKRKRGTSTQPSCSRPTPITPQAIATKPAPPEKLLKYYQGEQLILLSLPATIQPEGRCKCSATVQWHSQTLNSDVSRQASVVQVPQSTSTGKASSLSLQQYLSQRTPRRGSQSPMTNLQMVMAALQRRFFVMWCMNYRIVICL